VEVTGVSVKDDKLKPEKRLIEINAGVRTIRISGRMTRFTEITEALRKVCSEKRIPFID
jgi:hypothetical protein